jgi:hypothetical protein
LVVRPDPSNPLGLPDTIIGIYGSDLWNGLSDGARGELRRHHQACQMSQFLHGEQAAMLCAAKIVQQASDLDTKLYAATQAIDEARHVEIFTRLLEDKVKLAYPLTPALRSLLTGVIEEPRWDMTFLGMQVLVEGLAVAAFQRYRDDAADKRVGAIFAYVIQDGPVTSRSDAPPFAATTPSSRRGSGASARSSSSSLCTSWRAASGSRRYGRTSASPRNSACRSRRTARA